MGVFRRETELHLVPVAEGSSALHETDGPGKGKTRLPLENLTGYHLLELPLLFRAEDLPGTAGEVVALFGLHPEGGGLHHIHRHCVEESLPSLSDINEHALTRQGTPDEDFPAFVVAHTPAVLMETFQGKFDGLSS
jgi:hypothetical protein